MSHLLKEGKDFYYNEKGLMVFTATYLIDRGYCCFNQCTHCPYLELKINPKLPDLPDNHK